MIRSSAHLTSFILQHGPVDALTVLDAGPGEQNDFYALMESRLEELGPAGFMEISKNPGFRLQAFQLLYPPPASSDHR